MKRALTSVGRKKLFSISKTWCRFSCRSEVTWYQQTSEFEMFKLVVLTHNKVHFCTFEMLVEKIEHWDNNLSNYDKLNYIPRH